MKNEKPADSNDVLRAKILMGYTKLCEEFGEEETTLKFHEFVLFVLANEELRKKISKVKL